MGGNRDYQDNRHAELSGLATSTAIRGGGRGEISKSFPLTFVELAKRRAKAKQI